MDKLNVTHPRMQKKKSFPEKKVSLITITILIQNINVFVARVSFERFALRHVHHQ